MSLGALKWRDVCKGSEEENGCVCDVILMLYADNDDVLDTWKQFATRENFSLFHLWDPLSLSNGYRDLFHDKVKLTSDVRLL
jgi:hypothetical protein